MERKVLDDLGFHLSVPTANIFLRLLSVATHIDVYYLFSCKVVSSLTCLFFNFDQEIPKSSTGFLYSKISTQPHLNNSFQFICISSTLSCQTIFPGSFVYIVLSGQLSSRVDFDRLWFPEISSFSGGSIFSFPCKMDT